MSRRKQKPRIRKKSIRRTALQAQRHDASRLIKDLVAVYVFTGTGSKPRVFNRTTFEEVSVTLMGVTAMLSIPEMAMIVGLPLSLYFIHVFRNTLRDYDGYKRFLLPRSASKQPLTFSRKNQSKAKEVATGDFWNTDLGGLGCTTQGVMTEYKRKRPRPMGSDFRGRFDAQCAARGMPPQFNDFCWDARSEDWSQSTPEEWADWWCDHINDSR